MLAELLASQPPPPPPPPPPNIPSGSAGGYGVEGEKGTVMVPAYLPVYEPPIY